MPRSYVNNSYNRSLGRVGMPVGSAVVSSGSRSSASGSSESGYSASSTSSSTYVDNSHNRILGRVGLPLGSAVESRSTYSAPSSSSNKTYVDNALNRSLGRVGLEHGTAVYSRSSASASGDSRAPKTYVDNAFNRRVGRVGLPLGSIPVSSTSVSSVKSAGPRVYVDNAYNRKLGRVGLLHGTAVVSKGAKNQFQEVLYERMQQADLQRNEEVEHLYRYLQDQREQVKEIQPDQLQYYDQAEGILNRHAAAKSFKKSSILKPLLSLLPSGKIINFNDLAIDRKLGSGGFGDVHEAIWKGEYQVAVKKFRVQRVSQEKKKQFEDEVRMLAGLQHPKIVSFYGACIESPNLAIVMEFMAGGSLYDVLHVEGIELIDGEKYQMIEDCFDALSYLHDKAIAHRDIKSCNVLVSEGMESCKLGDFGLALKDEASSESSVSEFSVVGTFRYSPPEVLEGKKLTVEQLMMADIYSMGLTAVELLIQKIPFEGLNQHQVRRAVLDGERPSMDGYAYPEHLEVILKRCLLGKATSRPTPEAVLEEVQKLLMK